MFTRKWIIGAGMTGMVLASVAAFGAAETGRNITLQKPKASLNVDVMKAFRGRRSTRAFAKESVSLEDIGALLWAGYGTNRPGGKRTVPSAHGEDLLDLYALTDNGCYRYDPEAHALVFVSPGNIKGKIARQDFVASAPLVIVLVGKTSAAANAAPREQQLNFINFTAGCASENIYLAAGSLGLGTVVLAWIHPDVLTRSLRLKENQVPLYIMPVGRTQ